MNRRIVFAGMLGIACIALAWHFRSAAEPTENTTEGIIVAEAPARTYIKPTDSDSDGAPDWQEAIAPISSTFGLASATTKSSSTASSTLTDQFAVNFFEDVVRKKTGGSLNAFETENFIQKVTTDLSTNAIDTLFTTRDISIAEGNDTTALQAYGNLVAEITFLNAPTSTANEAEILDSAITAQNPALLEGLVPIVTSYERIVADTKALKVPSLLTTEHLNLLNAYNAVLIDIKSMQQAFSDPLYTMLRMKRYQDDLTGMHNALKNLYRALGANGVTYTEDDAAFVLKQQLQITTD